jgi:hypothetical protein
MKNIDFAVGGKLGKLLYKLDLLMGYTPVSTPEEAKKVKKPLYLYNPLTEEEQKNCISISLF